MVRTSACGAENGGPIPLTYPMPETTKYFVISESGFGGPLFRAAKRYVTRGYEYKRLPPQSSVAENLFINTVIRESSRGNLVTLSGRDPSQRVKTKIALFSASDSDDFTDFLTSKNLSVTTTQTEPLQLLIAIVTKASVGRAPIQIRKIDRDNLTKAEASARKFQEFVQKNSVAPSERPGRIRQLIRNGILNGEKPIVLNWICPPSSPLQLDPKSNKLYRSFNRLDLERCFREDYRLYPRVQLERDLSKAIAETGSGLRYTKAIADDNPFCLYPPSIEIDGETSVLGNIYAYSRYTQQALDQLVESPGILVRNWSDLIGSDLFRTAIELYKQTSIEQLLTYLPPNTLETELDVITKHTHLSDSLKPYLRPLAEDVIRQYAIEGYILYQAFDDNVILAWNESTRRSAIIDALRKAKGLPSLPKIFVLREKKEGRIVDDF